MAAAPLDVDYLSAYSSQPPQTLTTVIDADTSGLVRAVFDAFIAKAREHDELAADKLRADIELENAVRSGDTRAEGLRATAEKERKTVEELRTKLNEEENLRASMENELQILKSSSTTSTSEVETLRTRISTLEAGKRDTTALVESKTTANDELARDLQKQHQKTLELSQQITTLQQNVQNANSAASSAKFREQSLKQEVDLAKRNSEWYENELKTKSAEALKYRKEKGARVAELQRLNEETNSNFEALKRTEQALRNRLDEVQKKAEDSFAKVQQLQEDAAKSEEGFRQELESARRLAELQSQQTETHRNRLREVEASLEKVKDDAAEEVGRSRQEAEAERQDREQAEYRISELESQLDGLEAQVNQQRAHNSRPGTPRQGLNGSLLSGFGSPGQFATPGSARSKSTITATQAIDELYKTKGLLTTEKRRGDRLAAEIEEMMQSLEAKGPEMEELHTEHERLMNEIAEMSTFVDQTTKERDRAKKDARKAESELSTAHAECNILRQQLRDLSAQIRMLLCEMDARERGLDSLSSAERLNLERLARGEIGEDTFEGLTATDRFISQRLVVFRSISELQEKNQELLKVTRELGAQMEGEEALEAKNQAAKDHEEVQSLQGKIENYKDELQSLITRSESYIKERDMFRRMLQHRGQLPPNSDLASMFGQSVDANQNGLSQSIEHGGKDSANYATLLRDLQAQYDQYREEQTTDRRALKEQADKLSQEKGSLQAEIGKINSQLTLANERYDILHSNYAMLQNENKELQKRSQILSESSAKQDLRTQQVAEDLVDAKGLVESMRNENANLKAEKKLWKDIQDRLNQDNENLINERSRLNTLVSNQQTLQNERELSESETRRRLQSQVETLEAELSTTKRKLSDEVEDSKKAQLRKEYDAQQTQKRIDDLASSLSHAREELIAAKTTRDHLQSRVDELTIELKSAEERVEVLQPRPTPRSNAPAVNGGANDGELSREQELAIEVSELKRDLDLAKSELESTKIQMEQYKSISQSSEEELQSLNATQDQYREEMDRVIEEKVARIRELQQRADDISAELTNTNNELTTLRNSQSEVARQVEEEKSALEAEISRLKDEDERHSTAAQFHQQDLRAQAAIATKAQQDYENELVKHAEAAKQLQNIRAEHNQLKTESATLRAEAESARVILSQSEASWEDRRDHFEQELKELRGRRDDLNAQNKILHQQLEGVGTQISALQQSRVTSGDNHDSASPGVDGNNDRTADGLRELNTFLRREKEIIEVQYDLKVQEAKRLQQQYDYSQSQLDEARLKLDQERRAQADTGRSSIAHKDLMEKINELNLFRESSITLRNEARQAQTQLVEKTKRVEELTEQIQPLETRIRELEHGKETADGEMRLLQEDRDRWQKRTQDIISKYDRIDPAEMEQLKETIETLRSERDALLEEKQPMQEKLDALETEKAGWESKRQKIIDQAKERSRVQTKEIKDRTAERDAVTQEKESLQQQLSTIQQQLETAIQEKSTAEEKFATLTQEMEKVITERQQASNAAVQTPSAPAAPTPAPSQSDAALNQKLTELRQELDKASQQKGSLETQVRDLREELEKANSARDAAIAEAIEARAKQATTAPDTAMSDSREEGYTEDSSSGPLAEAEGKALEERIAATEAKLKEQEELAAKLVQDRDAIIEARSVKLRAAANKKLSEDRAAQKAVLEQEYALKLEQEKQIWMAENKSTQHSLQVSTEQAKTSSETPAASATPGTPATPNQNGPAAIIALLNDLPRIQVQEIIGQNNVMKDIIRNNVRTQTSKFNDEKVKALAEKEKAEADKAQALAEKDQKAEADKVQAETDKAQAVLMAEKKSSLQLNMASNRFKLASGKLELVEKASKETPQRAVIEVWNEAKLFKLLPAPAAAAPAPASGEATKPNGTVILSAIPAPKPAEVKSEAPATQAPAASATTNGTGTVPASSIPQPASGIPQPASNVPQRVSSIPTIRGGAQGGQAGRGARGGAGQIYQPQRGGSQMGGRGRGGVQNQGGRGAGLNASAVPYSPTGPAGQKRPREDSFGGPGNVKRGRGG